MFKRMGFGVERYELIMGILIAIGTAGEELVLPFQRVLPVLESKNRTPLLQKLCVVSGTKVKDQEPRETACLLEG